MKLCRTVLRLTLSCTLCSFFGLAVPVKSHSQDIIDGAKKEGKFLLYTSLTLQEIDEVAGPFTKSIRF